MNLSEMRRVLAEHHLRLTRSLGQNFLHDTGIISRIVRAITPEPGQTLIEIGSEKNTTVVFPVPIDLVSGFQKILHSGKEKE